MRVFIVMTWDHDRDHMGQPTMEYKIRSFTDQAEAAEVYKEARAIRDYAFYYVSDESGRMDLILEDERMPGG